MHFFRRTRLLYPQSIQISSFPNLGGLVRQIRGLGGNFHLHRSIQFSTLAAFMYLSSTSYRSYHRHPWHPWHGYTTAILVAQWTPLDDVNEHMTINVGSTTCQEHLNLNQGSLAQENSEESTWYQPSKEITKPFISCQQQIQTCLINEQRACDEGLAHVWYGEPSFQKKGKCSENWGMSVAVSWSRRCPRS